MSSSARNHNSGFQTQNNKNFFIVVVANLLCMIIDFFIPLEIFDLPSITFLDSIPYMQKVVFNMVFYGIMDMIRYIEYSVLHFDTQYCLISVFGFMTFASVAKIFIERSESDEYQSFKQKICKAISNFFKENIILNVISWLFIRIGPKIYDDLLQTSDISILITITSVLIMILFIASLPIVVYIGSYLTLSTLYFVAVQTINSMIELNNIQLLILYTILSVIIGIIIEIISDFLMKKFRKNFIKLK